MLLACPSSKAMGMAYLSPLPAPDIAMREKDRQRSKKNEERFYYQHLTSDL